MNPPFPGSVLLVFLLAALPLSTRQTTRRPARISGAAPRLQPRRPFPRHLTCAPGTIRPSHRSPAQQDRDVRRLFAAWKSRFLKPAGRDPWRLGTRALLSLLVRSGNWWQP
ncbi:MAG: hypothetical protein ACE5H3_04010 [Planctomycetota bacterium]